MTKDGLPKNTPDLSEDRPAILKTYSFRTDDQDHINIVDIDAFSYSEARRKYFEVKGVFPPKNSDISVKE